MAELAIKVDPREELLARIKQFFDLDHLVFLDWETFYRSKAAGGKRSFSLKNRTYADYIFDEEFHTTGLGIALDLKPVGYLQTPKMAQNVAAYYKERRAAGERIALLAHNAQFDGSVCGWAFGLTFDFYFCTRLISLLMEPHLSSSLRANAERLFPDNEELRKGGPELESVDGVRYEDMTPEQHTGLEWYCGQDTNLLRETFLERMRRGLPEGELHLMNITLRACIEPQFNVERGLLREVIDDEKKSKATAISAAIRYCYEKGVEEVAPGTFSSNQKYAALLKRFGLKIPYKLSTTTGKMTEALGKTDPDYIKLQIANPQLQALYKAREQAKSTIAKSRAERLIATADAFKSHGFIEADLPMFLNYYGALNTGRWSGGEKLNQQNLQRKSKHRLAHRAKPGYMIGVNDLSNIELRVNLWFCEQNDILQKFIDDAGFDSYSDLACDIYGRAINKKDDPNERQIGKAGCLGLGYAMSWYGFQQYLAGGPLGMEPMFVDDAFAKSVKMTYDVKHYAIVAMWVEIENYVLPVLATGGEYRFGRNKCVMVTKDKIHLPSGRVLHYPNTTATSVEERWGYRTRYSCDSHKRDRFDRPVPRSLHKGLIIENIIQAMSRDILGFQMVKTEQELQRRELGYVIGSVHDEILGQLKALLAAEGFKVMQECMTLLPNWAQGLPLASEGGYAPEYSK